MFRRKMRANYLPDMKQFQLQLYQLSRLVRDHIPDLYKWLDQNDVSPTLYAAPWILTVFSSQFPLGFVARVFGKRFMRIALRPTNLTKFLFPIDRFTLSGIVGGDLPRCNRIARSTQRRTHATRQFRGDNGLHEKHCAPNRCNDAG